MPKKKLAARFYDWLTDSSSKKPVKRMYAAARLDRKNADWGTRPTSANWEQRQSIFALRARAREAARDNPLFKKYLSMVRGNLIGPKGFQLQVQAKKADGETLKDKLNQTIEDAFRDWGHAETCTVSCKLDWLGVQRLIVTQLARDGEFLVQKVAANNKYGFSLRVINVDYLQETYNDIDAKTGNRIIMSVEIDADDKPVAYWLTTPASDVQFAVKRQMTRTRIPAEQMIHGFLVTDDESQVRGVTWFHAVLLNAKMYAGYVEGVVQSARFAAYVPGFLTRDTGEEIAFDGAEDPETGYETGATIEAENGSWLMLPGGVKPEQFDPKQPTQNHPAFAKTMQTETASGLEGAVYFNLSGDMEAVNFSSSRVGLDDARDTWKGLQDFVATTLCRDVYHSWLRAALLAGAVDVTAREMIEVRNPSWRGRGYKYIDPQKDMMATVLGLENNLLTLTDVLAEQGKDFTKHIQKIVAERDEAKKAGLDLVYVSSVAVKDAGTAPEDDEGKTASAPADKKKAAASG